MTEDEIERASALAVASVWTGLSQYHWVLKHAEEDQIEALADTLRSNIEHAIRAASI